MNKIHPAPSEFTQPELDADPILRFFRYSHLPQPLQDISSTFCGLAAFIVGALPRNAERSVALRKLLEAKDAGVRACVETASGAKPKTWYDRLLDERKDLQSRVEKLDGFISNSPEFRHGMSEHDQFLLRTQRDYMCEYLRTLESRIECNRVPAPAPLDEPVITGGDKGELAPDFKA